MFTYHIEGRGAISFYVYIVPLGLISIFLYVGRIQIYCGLLPTRFCYNFPMKLLLPKSKFANLNSDNNFIVKFNKNVLTETHKNNWAGQHSELSYWASNGQFKSKVNLPLEKVSKIPLGALTKTQELIMSIYTYVNTLMKMLDLVSFV